MSSSEEDEAAWIEWFCGLEGHELFCKVEKSYIEDGFNLYGLSQHVPNINACLDVILDRCIPLDQGSHLLSSAFMLYGLIHARFIVTAAGLETMSKKYLQGEFGTCPRHLCHGQPVLPVGLKDGPSTEGAKLFCPKCRDIYSIPRPSAGEPLDGAYFGTTFPHLFLMSFSHLLPDPPRDMYHPRIFGFKINQSSGIASKSNALSKSKSSGRRKGDGKSGLRNRSSRSKSQGKRSAPSGGGDSKVQGKGKDKDKANSKSQSQPAPVQGTGPDRGIDEKGSELESTAEVKKVVVAFVAVLSVDNIAKLPLASISASS
ncbi:unnamed protein product [Chrysoparadoxa australica]